MPILDTPRSDRREMMRADLRAREKAIRAKDPNPPEVRDLRLGGYQHPDTPEHLRATHRRLVHPALGLTPKELAAKGAAARRAERLGVA